MKKQKFQSWTNLIRGWKTLRSFFLIYLEIYTDESKSHSHGRVKIEFRFLSLFFHNFYSSTSALWCVVNAYIKPPAKLIFFPSRKRKFMRFADTFPHLIFHYEVSHSRHSAFSVFIYGTNQSFSTFFLYFSSLCLELNFSHFKSFYNA